MYVPIGSMYAIYGNIYHQYIPNVSIYAIHGSYGVYGTKLAKNTAKVQMTPMFTGRFGYPNRRCREAGNRSFQVILDCYTIGSKGSKVCQSAAHRFYPLVI